MKFRKRPVVIEATQWFPGTEKLGVIEAFKSCDNGLLYLEKPHCSYHEEYVCHGTKVAAIWTMEGLYEVTQGDWIITGIKGEKYPCKPDIFELTYEKVAE